MSYSIRIVGNFKQFKFHGLVHQHFVRSILQICVIMPVCAYINILTVVSRESAHSRVSDHVPHFSFYTNVSNLYPREAPMRTKIALSAAI